MSRAVLSPDTERLSRLTGLLQATLPLNPLASRRFLHLYRRQIATGQWAGHYEFLLPTIARAGGLKVADLGGNGPFVASGLAGRNYRNTPNDPDLGPGSFIFRPARDAYFAEAPEQFDMPNLLYHPIKVSA